MDDTIFRRVGAVADPTRARLLNLLERHEMTVGELCAVVQSPQSTVSRHLRVLAEESWVAVRAEGTSRYYRMSPRLPGHARRLWEVVGEALAGDPEAEQDFARARGVLASRRTRSQEFFSSTASEWDRVRADLFGERPEDRALPALLAPEWEVADLGCGTGQLLTTLAPFVARVVGVDESADMLEGARSRAAGLENVELRPGRLEALPLSDGEVDLAVASLVLHYVESPAHALGEAARILKPGGRVVVIDMQPHGRDEYRERMGHVWQGFAREQLEAWMGDAGLEPCGWRSLAADPAAKGPLLFVAVARRPGGGAGK